MFARFLRWIALGLCACSFASGAATAQPMAYSLPPTAVFDPSGAAAYRILLSATARRVVSEDECSSNCAAEALILRAAARDQRHTLQLCFENVQLQKFRTEDGGELLGAMTSVAVTALDENDRRSLTRRFRALLQAPPGRDADDSLCAPTRLELSSRKFLVDRDPLEVGRIEAVLAADEQVAGADLGLSRANATASVATGLIGGIVGHYSALHPPRDDNTLLSRLFGYRSSRVIQLDLRSSPRGASIIVDGRETGLQTDSLIAVAVRSLRNLRVRLGRTELPLEKCAAVRRRAGVAVAYDCRIGR